MYLIKTNDSGIEQWSQTFGESNSDFGYSVRQTTDGGYIVAGSAYSPASHDDVYMVKTDSSGNELWSQTYGGTSVEIGYEVCQTSDGGYIITGETRSYGAGGRDVYLIKTDASGNELWSQTIGGIWNDEGFCVQQTSDGGYIITGYTRSYGAGNSDVFLIKTDASGNTTWTRTFGAGAGDNSYSVQQTADGGYIIAGVYQSGDYDVYLIKTDESGNSEWTQTYGGISHDWGMSVYQTSDNGYIITGHTSNNTAGGTDAYMVKTDASGITQWTKTIGGIYNDYGYCVKQTYDGGYIFTGLSESFYGGPGFGNVWLVRVGTEAVYPDFDVDLTYVSGSPVPAVGGNLNYDLYIENTSGSAQDLDAWLEIAYEVWAPATVVLRSLTNYQPGWSINRPGMWYPIAESYAAGDYSFSCNVGENPFIAWAQDSFPFVKEGTDHVAGFVPFPVDGAPNPFNEIEIRMENDVPIAPHGITMLQINPNPFNPTTIASYELGVSSYVNLTVYDIQGCEVKMLVNGWQDAGYHEVTFDGSGLATGIYIYRLTAGDFTAVRKMVLMK